MSAPNHRPSGSIYDLILIALTATGDEDQSSRQNGRIAAQAGYPLARYKLSKPTTSADEESVKRPFIRIQKGELREDSGGGLPSKSASNNRIVTIHGVLRDIKEMMSHFDADTPVFASAEVLGSRLERRAHVSKGIAFRAIRGPATENGAQNEDGPSVDLLDDEVADVIDISSGAASEHVANFLIASAQDDEAVFSLTVGKTEESDNLEIASLPRRVLAIVSSLFIGAAIAASIYEQHLCPR